MSEHDASPLMRQYRDIKHGYPDSILFFRVGDFYEMFYEDAEDASKLLSIALTSRDKSSADPVPLCGVPHHAAQNYIAKLLQSGRTVAVCEQVEDPKAAKGLVRREVVRLYTPGTLVDTEMLDPSESNFLAAVSRVEPKSKGAPCWGLAALDVTTGEFWVMEYADAYEQVVDELARLQPKELIHGGSSTVDALSLSALDGMRICERDQAWFDQEEAARSLQRHFGVQSLQGFDCQDMTAGLAAAGAVWRYFRESQPAARPDHIRRLQRRRSTEAMHLDGTTIRNLELVRQIGDERRGVRPLTLLSVVDRTATAMGSRLLREWLLRPLVDCRAIEARLDAVSELKDELAQRVAVRSALRTVQDIARLNTRITLEIASPRELLALKQSLGALPALRQHLEPCRSTLLAERLHQWDDCHDVYDLIEQAIDPDAPLSVRDGGSIRSGYHPDVDELRKARTEGKGWIAALEVKERERTGIDSLKIRYNQVFGYYIEITKPNLAKVPSDFIRKQTLVNAERFMTAGLKELEERVTGAETKLLALEEELFVEVRQRIAHEGARLQAMAQSLALIDVLAGLAETAALYRYTRPTVDESGVLHIHGGRHPVVEQLGNMAFVPNDTLLDEDKNRLAILTGPNMAGKSTYLRQVALIVLLAQIGSFVPAGDAHIGLVDRIFTRVGASDNLAAGQSTFMVEMLETAHILNCASHRSLILLDEIGRGTSTYDGLSIAWAIAEFIHDPQRLGARTLFATHYHEMTELETLREGIRNYRVAVQERDGDVVFLRKIVPGGADRSYGIHVAKLAGLPASVIARAQQVLEQLEQPDSARESLPVSGEALSREPLPQRHPLIDEVRQIDLFSMTPLDALNRLADLQKRATES